MYLFNVRGLKNRSVQISIRAFWRTDPLSQELRCESHMGTVHTDSECKDMYNTVHGPRYMVHGTCTTSFRACSTIITPFLPPRSSCWTCLHVLPWKPPCWSLITSLDLWHCLDTDRVSVCVAPGNICPPWNRMRWFHEMSGGRYPVNMCKSWQQIFAPTSSVLQLVPFPSFFFHL